MTQIELTFKGIGKRLTKSLFSRKHNASRNTRPSGETANTPDFGSGAYPGLAAGRTAVRDERSPALAYLVKDFSKKGYLDPHFLISSTIEMSTARWRCVPERKDFVFSV